MSEAAMALIRKQKKRQRDKLRRQRQPRAEYLAASLAHTKPWEQEGKSRATWYREQPETGVRQVNLTKTECIRVSKEEHSSNAGLCGRVSTPTPAGLVQTCVSAQTDWLTTY